MLLHGGGGGEAPVALRARVRLLPGVYALVLLQVGAVVEALGAVGALVLPLPRVDALVTLQVTLGSKTAAAQLAAEGFLSAVRLLVERQAARRRVTLGAHVTHVRP